jgi:hypothetical protein
MFNTKTILKKLPVLYRKLSEKKFDKAPLKMTRVAPFKNYKAGESICFSFYKPITRMIDEKRKGI